MFKRSSRPAGKLKVRNISNNSEIKNIKNPLPLPDKLKGEITIVRKSDPIIQKPSNGLKKLDVIIISVNYNDYLVVSLSNNVKIFDNITVVTSSDDLMCQKICEKFGVNCLVTDVMYENGAKFNKGKAINKGIESIVDPNFILLLDADIIVTDKINIDELIDDNFYISDRWICRDYNFYKRFIDGEIEINDIGKCENNKGLGFFQLFNINNNSIDKSKVFPEISDDAAWSDLMFRDKFTKRQTIKNDVIHLGDPYMNWNGRRTNRFLTDEQFSDIFQKKSTFTICSYYFNFRNDVRQKNNFLRFIKQFEGRYENLIVGIIDYGDIDFQLPCETIIIKGDVDNKVWSKEIIINKIIDTIDDVEYLIWIDGDLIYDDLSWLDNIDDVVKDNDFVQLFENINYLNESEEITHCYKSMGFKLKSDLKPMNSTKISKFENRSDFKPGGAWLGKFSILKEKKLFEKMYVGGGDVIFLYGINGVNEGFTLTKVKESNEEIYNEAVDWINSFGRYNIGYLKQTTNHLYHGDMNSRNYIGRYKKLSKFKEVIDPKTRGIMLISFGFDYEKITPNCVRSIRRFSDLPIIIHTNIPEFVRSNEWNELSNITFITHEMNDDENRIIKTQLSKYTKFDQTIYIDVDSSVISDKFIYPFDYLDSYDIVCPEWKTYKIEDLRKLSETSNKFKKFLQIAEKFKIESEKFVAGGVCYFNRNSNSDKFFEDFHKFWIETGKKEDMPGLNGAMIKNKELVKIISNSEFNNYNSTIIVSHHNSTIDYSHMKDFTRKRYNPKSDRWEFCDQGSTDMYTKPKISFIYDIFGWAFYIMSYNVKSHLYKYFEIDIIKCDSKFDEEKYDAIICFSPGVLPEYIKNKSKIICGISSHKSGKNLEKLKDFRFSFSNDLKLYKSIDNINKFYIENGINTEFFQIKKKNVSKKFRIGSIGSKKWEIHKGKYRIDEICNKLGLDYENKSLFIETSGSILSQKEILEYYSNIDVFVISSVSETGPNTLLESMSCGIPVISNKVGLSTIIIENGVNGILIEDINDIDSYVDAIISLKNNKDMYDKISNNSKVSIKNWDWSKKSLDFEKMINKFIGHDN